MRYGHILSAYVVCIRIHDPHNLEDQARMVVGCKEFCSSALCLRTESILVTLASNSDRLLEAFMYGAVKELQHCIYAFMDNSGA